MDIMKTTGAIALAIAARDDQKAIKTLLDGIPGHIASEVREQLPRQKQAGGMRYVQETKSAYFIYYDPDKIVCFTFLDVTLLQAEEIWARITDEAQGAPTTDTILDIYQSVTGAAGFEKIGITH